MTECSHDNLYFKKIPIAEGWTSLIWECADCDHKMEMRVSKEASEIAFGKEASAHIPFGDD